MYTVPHAMFHVQNVRESAGGCWGVREIFRFSSEESNHIGNLLQYLDVEQFIFLATEFNCHLASTEPPASKVSKYCTAEKCLFLILPADARVNSGRKKWCQRLRKKPQ